MLAIFLAAGAFKKYHTLEQVLAVKPPADQRYWVLEWADRVLDLDLPVFPEVSAEGSTEKIQTATSFSTQVKGLSLRAGMENPVTIHSGRRETLIQRVKHFLDRSHRFQLANMSPDNGYAKDELMKFAAHTNQMTLTRDYLSSITGLASFLKLPLRSDQAEDFRSMTVKRNPDLFLSLPAKAQDNLQQRSNYVAITKKIEGLSLEVNAARTQSVILELKSQRNQLLEQRRMLEKEELNRVRGAQERIHPSEREGTFHVDQHRSQFGRVSHMMEERYRLSHTLFCVAPLRSAEDISAVEDLTALLRNSCRAAYQPLLRPTRGRCPVPHCAVGLE